MLALAFLNPWMLLAVAAVALPIIIHWLSRQRYRRIDWAALRFLREAENEQRRRRRFEQWLLLALRCLAVALLALLIARPFVRPGLLATLLGAGGARHRVLVIDDSASLGYQGAARTDFEQLRATAEQTVDWLAEVRAGDTLSVYLTSQRGMPLWPAAPLGAASVNELRAPLRAMQRAAVPARPGETLAAVADEVAAQGGADGVDIYVLSDFQRSEWTDLERAPQDAFAPLRDLDPERTRLVLVAAATPDRENIAVETLRPARGHIVAGVPAQVEVTVANYTARPLEDFVITLEVDGVPQPALTLERVAPGERGVAAAEITFADPGWAEVVARIADRDGLTLDNIQRIAVDVAPALRVLLVNGAPSATPARDEVFYLRSALAPPGAYASGMQVDVHDPLDLPTLDLAAFDCIMLCNVGPLDGAAAELLRRYVRAGGGLAVFLGDSVYDPDAMNTAFGVGGVDGLLPARLVRLAAVDPQDDPVRLEPAGQPGVALLPTDLGLGSTVSFQRWVELAEPPAAGAARTVARFTADPRPPAFVLGELGAGRLALLASSVDADWNTWPRAVDGSYVIAMLELVHHLAGRRQIDFARPAGAPLRIQLPARIAGSVAARPPAWPEAPAVPLRPDAEPSGDPRIVFAGPAADQLGVYTIVAGDDAVARLAVNADPIEAPLAGADERELRPLVGTIPLRWVRPGEAIAGEDTSAQRELWPALLGLLLAILVGEQFLVERIHRRESGEFARGARRAAPRARAA